MKKFILATVAAGAMAMGAVAHADVIDSVGTTISRLFGVPYNPGPTVPGTIYTDPSGHRYQVDAAGRSIPLDQYGSYRDPWGRTVYLGANNQPAFIEQNGQLIPYGTATYAMGPSDDRDADGVPNLYDRYPDDARYR